MMNHEEWVQSLKVGDMVCDCRFNHVKIREITDELDDNGEVLDRLIITEDGKGCSALHCCDPVDSHKISDHPESETQG